MGELLRRIHYLLHRRRMDEELQSEMEFHREMAGRAGQRSFGNTLRLREQSREAWGWVWLDRLGQDLRYAMRQLSHNRGFAATAIGVLGLGICASVALFAFVDAALIKPLPYTEPARLVAVYEATTTCPHCNLSYADFQDWKKASPAIVSDFDVWTSRVFLRKTADGIAPAPALRATTGLLHTLGITPLLGRGFTAADGAPGKPHTALLTYPAWQRIYNSKGSALGTTVTLDDTVYTIIGVLPRSFSFAPRGTMDFVVPIQALSVCEQRRGCHNLYGVARLQPGVSTESALAAMTSIAAGLEKQYPASNRGQGAAVISLNEAISGDIRPILLTLLGGAVLLLLIATANVSGLLLVRAESRRREMAVRSALGASPARLLRQVTTEALVLAFAGGVLGSAASFALMAIMIRLIPQSMLGSMPYLAGLGTNWRVAVFAAAVSLLSAAVFTLTPMIRLPFGHLRDELAEGGRTSAGRMWRRFGAPFVVVELAIAMTLLAGAGLLGKSFYRLLHVPLGYDATHLATVSIAIPDSLYSTGAAQIALYHRILEGLNSLPGVQSAALTSDLPTQCNCDTTWFRILGKPWNGTHNEAPQRDVSVAYFSTLRARILRGRFFTEADKADAPPVAIINRTLAERYFAPGEDPVGQTIGNSDLAPKSFRRIVGVIDDVREGGLSDPAAPVVYYPLDQDAEDYAYAVLRTGQSPESMLPAMVAELHHIDPRLGTLDPQSMRQLIDGSPVAYLHRSAAWLAAGFAVLALLLGAIGLYGVIAYSVGQRRREIGVRLALGAQRSAVYRLVLAEAGWLTSLGIGLGMLGAVGAATLLASSGTASNRGQLLFAVHAWDPAVLLTVALLLAAAAALASFLPARRAAAVNPVEALRAE
ncbi:ABC transporter permease [Silvibacterium dinghuense]|uniref:ABC transporter permease n=1 Tax=Silvibacterium dinghuense TaxID=1560006 RepID=A0A4Q1SIM1_9BACT|nr:ABC transporter permease [Silvibacterium dinghuense]RXS97255.1 ABC transporter permease [Silvibacterium dinghuense]GGG97512.1 hypothetical protein GCM10011586_11000 [Silvibacterium dinghuense]